MNSSAAAVDPPAVKPLLKPGFTALSNALVDTGMLARLKPAELMLLVVLARFSTGFLRNLAIVSQALLLELTGMCLSTLYEAKKGLVGKGILTISHTRTRRCCYRLTPAYQPLLSPGEVPENPSRPAWARSSAPAEVPPSRKSDVYKEHKEILDHHHRAPDTPPPKDDDDSSRICSERTGPASPSCVQQLLRHGVNEFMAHRLAKDAPAEVIEKALQRVAKLTLDNPAGYLVREIQRGGYREKPDPTQAQREYHRALQEKRQTQRDQETLQHQQAQAENEQLWQLFLTSPPAQQAALKQKISHQAQQENLTRLRGWGEDHPAWKGLLLAELRALQHTGAPRLADG